MPNKYNIYRLKKENEAELVSKLESVGLKAVGHKTDGDTEFTLYFSTDPELIDIWWVGLLSDFLPEMSLPKNLVHFGVLLISQPGNLYALSFGKSHFYLRPFCHADFGLQLAERIADLNDLRVKNSKYYKSKRSQAITTFQKGSEAIYDGGESLHFIKAKTLDASKWGKVASFGSSVQFVLEMPPDGLTQLVGEIENELLKPSVGNLPQAIQIYDPEKIAALDAELVNEISGDSDESAIGGEEFMVSGVDFVFAGENQYSLYIKKQSRNKYPVDSLSIENLRSFLREQQIDLSRQLDDIRVHIQNDITKPRSEPLKSMLDYVDSDRYCLINGKWHHFNESYLRLLQMQVDTIQIEQFSQYDLLGRIEEKDFNEARIADGFNNLDRKLSSLDNKFRVELMDLYKDHTLFFVKIGGPKDFAYVFDQAMNTLALMKNNEVEVTVEDEPVKVERFCLWMVFDRKQLITKLSEVNSIIFQMKAAEWRRAVYDAGYVPIVWINYRR